MITSDQPKIFGSELVVALSSVDDGNMKKRNMPEGLGKDVDSNRKQFLEKSGIKLNQAFLVNLSYDKDNFAVYKTVSSRDSGKGLITDSALISDALATKEKGVALFLPLADCVGAIIYDPKKEVLMVSHLGRHSTEQRGGTKSIQYMVDQFNSDPKDILVWLSPAADSDSYPLFAFDHTSLHQVSREHLLVTGVLAENIEISNIDTATNGEYFSHSQFKLGNRKIDGRFAIVAMMR